MRTTDPAALCKSILPALPLLLLLIGCAVDEDAPPEDTTPVVEEVLSPVHDIRVAEWDLWSGMATTAEVFLAPENREGWTFSWRVGGGEIVGSGREVVWTTPLADSCWIESTIHRNGEEHLCRHWIHLRNDPPTLRLEASDASGLPGILVVQALVNRPLPEQVHMCWGDDQGSSFGGSGAQQHWPVYARGRQQVWAVLVLGLWEVADTLVVDVPNIAPEWGPGFGDDWGPWPVGGDVFDRVHVLDLNLDRLSLEFLDLGGFLLVDSAWVPNDTWDYHGT